MYFKVEQDEENFIIYMNDKFYEYCGKYSKNESFFNITYRLFNLLPKDFYHYVGYKYNASFKKCDFLYFVKMFFKEKKDAQAFCKELNRRFQYCVDRGDFN